MMGITYDTTLDEIVQGHLRMAERARTLSRARRNGVFWTAVLTGLIIFALLAAEGAPLTYRLAVSVLGICAGVGWFLLTHRRSTRRRLMKYLREQMHSDGPFPFAVELREDCLWTRQGAHQLSFDWSDVAELVDTGEAVEFWMREGGFVIVRSRGFPDAECREEFKRIAKQRMDGAARRSANLQACQ